MSISSSKCILNTTSSIYPLSLGKSDDKPKDDKIDSTAELNSLQCNAQGLTKPFAIN